MTITVLTDIDGVVLDFFAGFEAFMAAEGFKRRELRPGDDPYDLSAHYGIRMKQALALVEMFFDTPAAARVPSRPDARAVIPTLAKKGARFVGITASPHNARKARVANIFGSTTVLFDNLHCVGLGGSKRDLLKAYSVHNPVIWVEDHLHNALDGAQIGIRTFLIDQPWNRHAERLHPNITRVETWHDIRKEIGL